MKRYQWWSIFGIGGASVTAALLGQTVMGQPGPKLSPPIDVPIVIAQSETGRKPVPYAEMNQELAIGKMPDLLPSPDMKTESGPTIGSWKWVWVRA